jgi:hypothetical protein
MANEFSDEADEMDPDPRSNSGAPTEDGSEERGEDGTRANVGKGVG